MSFDLTTWKQAIATRLKHLHQEMPALGIQSLFGFLTTITLLPVVQAATANGDPVAAVLGLAGSVGGNLLATELEKWRDRANGKEVARELSETLLAGLAQSDELRDELDALWHLLHLPQTIRQSLPPEAAKEARHRLDRERTLLLQGNYLALVGGTGNVVAQGPQSVAQGERSTYIREVHGNVIQEAARDPAAPDGTALRHAYLEYLFSRAGVLPLELIDRRAGQEARQVALDAIYTALWTTEAKALQEAPDGARHPFRPPSPPSEEMTRAHETRQRYTATEQLNRHRHLVLLGDPGSGKSTFVNFVALCLAGEACAHPDINLTTLMRPLPTEEAEEEDFDFDDEDDEEIGVPASGDTTPVPVWEHGVLLPVHVILRDFAVHGLPPLGETAGASHLFDFIRAELQQHTLGDFFPFLAKELRERGGILLLDGLDEVPEAESRRVVLKAVIESLSTAFPKCRIVVTGRTYSYQNQEWQLAGFKSAILAPFTEGQIRHFVSRWYAHLAERRGEQSAQAEASANRLKAQIAASDRLSDMARRPILLTLMASIHAFRGGSLPEKRQELYAEAVDLLLDWWEERRVRRQPDGSVVTLLPSLSEYLNLRDKSKIRALLERLAYEAHAHQTEMRGTADIAEKELVFGLYQLREGTVDPHHLVAYLRDRAGLLLPRGVGVYTFPHRSFQEYLAACYFTSPACPNQPEELAEAVRTDPERWREVALLAAAKGAAGSATGLWVLVDCLCPTVVTEKAADLWGAMIAGQILQENRIFLANVGRSHAPKLERVRQWQAAGLRHPTLSVLERVSAGNVLATLGDPRFDAEHWYLPKEPLLGFVEIPAGAFTMGEGKSAHSVTLPRYWMARYPITVAQWHAYLQATNSTPRDPDSLQGIANHPVVIVTWQEAIAYSTWLTDRLKALAPQYLALPTLSAAARMFWEGVTNGSYRVRLPSEAEWERAARFTDGRTYPWGESLTPERANYDDTQIGDTSPVGAFPQGRSAEGIEELSGNVWEWTRSLDAPYPYRAGDGRENVQTDGLRVVRGGAFYNNEDLLRGAVRVRRDPNLRYYYIGFRVCVSPFSL